jgi:GNAT superfamily N-acetyltransferase
VDAVPIVAIPADFGRWQEVLELILDAFSYMDGVIDPPSSAHLLTADILRDKARSEAGFLAFKGGEIIGCVFACERATELYVGKLAVAKRCQGQGIGRRLVEAVEQLARERAKTAIELQARIELTANHLAFARLGFRETERTAHDGYEKPTSITMRKELP